jgi:hypothetical protein
MYPFMLIETIMGDPTLGARGDDPTVSPTPEKTRRGRALRLPRVSFARQRGVRSALSFAFSSGRIDSEQTCRTNWRSVSSNR